MVGVYVRSFFATREAGSEFKHTAVYWLVYMLGHSTREAGSEFKHTAVYWLVYMLGHSTREAGSEFKHTAVYWLVYMLGHSSQHDKLAVSSNIQLCIGWCIC